MLTPTNTRHAPAGSLRVVVVALLADLTAAIAKLVAATLTGSSAMWAEAFHALADCGNALLLLLAERRSDKPADERHPLGHGRAAYLWALIASMGVFGLGALLSIRQGIEGLLHAEGIVSFQVAYAVLFISTCLDGISLLQAQRTMSREARSLRRTFMQQLDLGSDPVVRAVFAEDAAALVGDVVALAGIGLHQATGSAAPDGIAAIIIGVLLGVVAIQLAARNGYILVGGQAPVALCKKLEALVVSQPGVVAVTELLVTFIGPRRLWVVARVAIDDTLSRASVEQLLRGIEAALRQGSPAVVRADIVPSVLPRL